MVVVVAVKTVLWAISLIVLHLLHLSALLLM